MEKIEINLQHGFVDGFLLRAESTEQSNKLAIIVNGLNGFATYGMFPQLQHDLYEQGISSISFNFSHGGVRGDADYFTEIDLYEKNCMRLEVEDIKGLVNSLSKFKLPDTSIYLISHSLGSIPTCFAARDLLAMSKNIQGIIFIAPSMILDFWGEKNMQQWELDGKLMYDNKRTEQSLPLGLEYFQETKESASTWNLENALKETPVKYLILHGDKDESIPMDEAKKVQEWNETCGNISKLVIVENASHTFNISHPFQSKSDEYVALSKNIVAWIID